MKKLLIYFSIAAFIFLIIRYLVNEATFRKVEISSKITQSDTTRLPWADITAPNWEIGADKRRFIHEQIDSLYKSILGKHGNYYSLHRDNFFIKDRLTAKEWVDSLFSQRWYDKEGYQHQNYQIDYDGDSWGANYDMCLALDILIKNPTYISTYISYYTVEQNYGKRKTNTTSNVNMRRMKAEVLLHIVLKGQKDALSGLFYGSMPTTFERDAYLPLGQVIYGIEQPNANVIQTEE